MRLVTVVAGVALLEHDGHRFRLALTDLLAPDARQLASPEMACIDGDGYTCRASWPLAGERDAQRLFALRARAVAPTAITYAEAIRLIVARIEAAGGVPRIAPEDADPADGG